MPHAPTSSCPCGSAQAEADCCGALHAAFRASGALLARDAQALMRSRYCAFVRDERAYLLASWHASTRPAALEPPPPGLRWLGLTVTQHHCEGDAATVTFVARSKLGGRAQRLVETSRFVREHGQWFYVDGDVA